MQPNQIVLGQRLTSVPFPFSFSRDDNLSDETSADRHAAWRGLYCHREPTSIYCFSPGCKIVSRRLEVQDADPRFAIQTTSYITAIETSYVTRPGPASTVTLPGSVYTSIVSSECSATPIAPVTQCATTLTSISTAYATRTVGRYNSTILTTATNYEVRRPKPISSFVQRSKSC